MASSWPITIRIATMPSSPPVMITHSFGDIATATRIESMAKTMSVSSTLTTVAQNADSPSHGLAFGRRAALLRVAAAEEVVVRQPQQVEPADQLHEPQLDHVRGKHRRRDAERERADDAVAQRLPLLLLGQAEHEHRQHHGVVGAQQSFEHDEQGDGDEVTGRSLGQWRDPRVGASTHPSIQRPQVDTTRVNVYT